MFNKYLFNEFSLDYIIWKASKTVTKGISKSGGLYLVPTLLRLYHMASYSTQLRKSVCFLQERYVRSLGGEDSLEEKIATHSCLENPMDQGDWWDTAHGVTKSLTRACTLSHFIN